MRALKTVKSLGLLLTKPHIVFYTMVWLMTLLVVGTIAQKYIGLYHAQNLFFSSWVIWWGPLFLPGTLTTLGLLTLCLMAKLFLASRWEWRNCGTIVTHIGALLLLLGGFITYLHAQEGSMTIYEGSRSNYFSDYHDRELVVEDQKNKTQILTVPWDSLKEGKIFSLPDLPVHIEIVKLCKNCALFPRKKGGNDPSLTQFRGMAQKIDIAPLPSEKEEEQNRSAIQFKISGAGQDKEGIHFSTDFIDISPWIEVDGRIYTIALRHKRTVLPFDIELIDFTKTMHPGTDQPKSYKSEIILHEEGSEWKSIIQMNDPLRYRGYTFYQSSFIEEEQRDATVFAVVKNAGRLFPYIASMVMCIGLLIHILLRLPKLVRKKLTPIFFLGFLTATSLYPSHGKAEIYAYNFQEFAQIPILDQGRIKPLDTFARTYLEIFSGRDSLPDMEAIDWFAELLFEPYHAYHRKIFNIPNPKVVEALELQRYKDHRYSYKEITRALSSHSKTWTSLLTEPPETLSLPQKQLVGLFTKIQLFAEISRSVSLLFPDVNIQNKTLAETLDIDVGTHVNFLTLRRHHSLLQILSKDLHTKTDNEMTSEERALQQLALHMKEIVQDQNSQHFKVIPPQWSDPSENNDSHRWFSPWGISLYGQGSPESLKFLNMWSDLLQAYRMEDSTQWDMLTTRIRVSSLNMANNTQLEVFLKLEVMFNQTKPFMISFLFYLVAFLTLMASFIIWSEKLRKTAFALSCTGFIFHLTGLGLRMFIMQRPPVTNLYESIIFVSLIACLFGLLLEWRLKNSVGLIIATSMGTLLHFIGIKFDADGDTMGMLIAVLDTNFWLSTHVVTITIGYGCCLVGGVLGHVYLLQNILDPKKEKRLLDLASNMRGVVFVALLFTSIGTLLGGIWADQSWGRFWGWDPKENGALLIVLWLIFLIHGRLSGVVDNLKFAAGMVCTNIIVVMAWFGVNLLSIGLHSYGFTEGAAVTFFVFCGLEFLFALSTYSFITSKNKTIHKVNT